MAGNDNSYQYAKLPAGEKYSWKDNKISLEKLQQLLEYRREQLLDEVEENGLTGELRDEWFELLLERDRVLRLLLKKENEEKLQQLFTTLLQLLVTIGQFDHSSTSDTLKAALYSLYKELSVQQANQAELEQSVSTSAKSRNTATETVPPAPPPPPTLEVDTIDSPNNTPDGSENHNPYKSRIKASAPKRLKLEDSDLDESISLPHSRERKKCVRSPLAQITPKSSQRRRTLGSKHTPRSRRTPKSFRSEDLRRCLLTGKDNLKSTPGLKRSPGGTPERKPRDIFSDSPSDMLTVALKKKFYNVRRLYGSPIKDDEKQDSREASFNLSVD